MDEFEHFKSRYATFQAGGKAAYTLTTALQISGVITTKLDSNGNVTWIFADHVNVKARHTLLNMREFLVGEIQYVDPDIQ